MTKNEWSVYLHLFPNGKTYVGITSRDPKRRWNNGNGYHRQPKMARAIKKYGWSNVSHLILATDLSENEAIRLERFYIAWFDSRVKGYNITAGGEGSFGIPCSAEKKAKISKANKGKPNTTGGANLKAWQAKHGSWNKARKLSEEHLRKITEERRKRCNKAIIAFDPRTHLPISEYESCVAAAKAVGVSKNNISRCALGGRKTSGGYEWRYKDASI